MKKYRKFVILGAIALGVSLALSIVAGVVFPETVLSMISGSYSYSTDFLWVSMLVGFATVLFDGGLFLVIFFSIKGKKLDKRNQQVVESAENK